MAYFSGFKQFSHTTATRMATRPEHLAPPEVFYNESEAQKYSAKYALPIIIFQH